MIIQRCAVKGVMQFGNSQPRAEIGRECRLSGLFPWHCARAERHEDARTSDLHLEGSLR